jgi:glycosyltransferase involved in cell wall biosynthesis
MYLIYFLWMIIIIRFLTALNNYIYRIQWTSTIKSDASARISLLVPARNEEVNISNIINDVLTQEYENWELLILDDDSEDNTRQIAQMLSSQDQRIRILHNKTLPDGWLGKNHACHLLAQQATGSCLCFLDADVRITPHFLSEAMHFMENNPLDMFSIFPKQIMLSKGEEITVPLMNQILLSLLSLPLVQKFSNPSLAAANGQCMFYQTKSYQALLPHQYLKNEKVEDIKIARFFKTKNQKIACLASVDSISCRMYTSYTEAINGFAKNVIEFFGGSYLLAIIYFMATSFAWTIIGLKMGFWWMILALILDLLTRSIISLTSNQSPIRNTFYSIAQQLALGHMILKSAVFKLYLKETWKGRTIN